MNTISKKKIAFVINPNAGVKKKINIIEFIQKNFNPTIAYDFIVWKNKHDFDSVKQQIINGNYSCVVACGGDGTVNQVASSILGTTAALGILPLGSGNGLARTNGINLNLKLALKQIEVGETSTIDSATINQIPFFCTAGIGFDALIANLFASNTKRGFISYATTSIKAYFGYQEQVYSINIDKKVISEKAFLITIANAGQWGNNVYIAPQAKINDGILNISILKPFRLFNFPVLGIKLFTKNIHSSRFLSSETGKKIIINFNGTLPVHYDGEPMHATNSITIEVVPNSLKIVH